MFPWTKTQNPFAQNPFNLKILPPKISRISKSLQSQNPFAQNVFCVQNPYNLKIPSFKNPAIAILKSICKNICRVQNPFVSNAFLYKFPLLKIPSLKIPSLKISVGYKIPSLKMPFCTKLLCSNPLQYQNPFALNFCRVQNPFFRNPFSKILPV